MLAAIRPPSARWIAEAKGRFDSGMDDWMVPDDKVRFQHDLDDAVTGNGKVRKTKSRGKREENKETVRRAKDQSAVQRTIDRPLSSAAPFGPAPSTNSSVPTEDLQASTVSYDDAPLMTDHRKQNHWRKIAMTPADQGKISALCREAERLEEDATYSSKGHFNAEDTWVRRNYWLGVRCR